MCHHTAVLIKAFFNVSLYKKKHQNKRYLFKAGIVISMITKYFSVHIWSKIVKKH